MTDTVIKGTGNSRLLKSVPNLATLAPTFDKLLEMLTTEGLPVDVLGPYAAGISTMGTGYSKGEVLPNTVCTALGLATSATPAQAFQQLRSLITTAQNTANGRCRFEKGSYVGNATSPKSLSFSISPQLVIVETSLTPNYSLESNKAATPLVLVRDCNYATAIQGGGQSTTNRSVKVTWSTYGVSWYSSAEYLQICHNVQDVTYCYIAIG